MRKTSIEQVICALEIINEMQVIINELVRVCANAEQTAILLTKYKQIFKDKREVLDILASSIAVSKRDLGEALLNIYITFNDVEGEIFIKYYIYKESMEQIAKELNISKYKVSKVITIQKRTIEGEINYVRG